MDLLLQIVHGISPVGAQMLLSSVWQGVLLTLCAGAGLRLVKNVSPAVRSRLWTSVLLLTVLLPAMALAGHTGRVVGHGEVHVAERWSALLLLLWAACSAVRAVQLGINAGRLWRLAARAVPVPVEPGLGQLLAGPRRATLCVSGEVNRPSVAGFFRPKVLLPVGLLEALAPAELEHVVLHEMEHLRRYDDWLNLLQQISLVLLPLNPALLWLDRQLCRERELACDDGVLAATKAHRAYAACLVKLAEESMMRKGVALALSALGTRARESELGVRVRRILATPRGDAHPGRTGLVVGLLSAASLAGVVSLARGPQWVSFDATPSLVAQAPATAWPSMASTGRMVPARMRVGLGSVRPALAEAMTARPAVLTARPARWAPAEKRRAALRTLRQPAGKAAMLRTTNPLRLTSAMRSTGTVSGLERVNATAARTPASRVVVTELQVSQPMYAAVPWRGGWLIVEL